MSTFLDDMAALLNPTHRADTIAKFPTPGHLATHLDATIQQTPALDIIDGELQALLDQPGGRLIVSMPPQQGKSKRISQVFPVWALLQKPQLPIIVASYGEGLAERNGETIRNTIAWNKLGIDIATGSSSKKRWSIANHGGGVLSVGIGSGMTGWASGLTIIDDPIKDRAEADSKVYRDRVWNWWLSVAQTRLAPGAPVVVVLTRWHADDLAGRLLKAADGHRWRVVNIPAQCENADTDPLGRQVGEYMHSARLIDDPVTHLQRPMTAEENTAYWKQIKVAVGSQTWAALYQGHPSPAEGGILKREWWQRYHTPQWVDRPDGTRWAEGFDEIILSADLAFKGTATSDYVAIGAWGRRGTDAYLLDLDRRHLDFVSTVHAFTAMAKRWPQATLKLVEDKANGPALISMLSKRVQGIVPVNPTASKLARVHAWAPLLEARHIWIPSDELCPWVGDFVEEAAGFPNAAHDDSVDMTSQAVDRLLLRPFLADDTVEDDEYDDYRIGY